MSSIAENTPSASSSHRASSSSLFRKWPRNSVMSAPTKKTSLPLVIRTPRRPFRDRMSPTAVFSSPIVSVLNLLTESP